MQNTGSARARSRPGTVAAGGLAYTRRRFAIPPETAMLETNALETLVKDLTARASALKEYL